MQGNWLRPFVPLLLAVAVSACSNGVQPGIVSTTSGPPVNGSYGGPVASGSYGTPANVPANSPAQGSAYATPGVGESGRVVSIREVAVQGVGGGYGGGSGPVFGGLLGAGVGATIGAITAQTLGGGIVGAVLGAVGGAIAGTIVGGPGGPGSHGGQGIEVVVQRDDGQKITVAQRDDGDIQLGDRVQIVQNRQGVAQVVRDTSRNRD